MADLLISASAADQAQAEKLGQIFVDRGFSVDWMTLDPSEPGARGAILSRRASARATLALWSKHSVADPAVVEEAREGLRRGTLLAARLDEAAPPPEFRAAGVANLATWDGSISSTETTRLLAELKKLLERTATRPALAMAAARMAPRSYGAAAPDLRPRIARPVPQPAAPVPAVAKLPAPVVAPVVIEAPAPLNPTPEIAAKAEAPIVVAPAPSAPPPEPLFGDAPMAAAPVQTASAANDSAAWALQPAPTMLASAAAQSAPVLREVKSAAPQADILSAPVAVRASSPAAPRATAPDPQFASIPESRQPAKADRTHLDEMFPAPPPRQRSPESDAPPAAIEAASLRGGDGPRKRLLKEPRPRTRRDDVNHAFAWLGGLAAAGVFLAVWLHERPEDFKTAAPKPAAEQFAKAEAPALAQPQSEPLVLTPPPAPQTTAPATVDAPIVTPSETIAPPAETKIAEAPVIGAPSAPAAAPPAAKTASAPPVKVIPAPAPKPAQTFAAATPNAKPVPKLGARVAVDEPPVLRPRRLGVVPKAIAAPKTFAASSAAADLKGAPSTDAAASAAPPQAGPQAGLSSERLAALGQSLDKAGVSTPETIEALARANAAMPSAPVASAFAAFDAAPSVTALQFDGDAAAFHLPGLAPSLLAAWQPGLDAPAPALAIPLTENDWDVAAPRVIAQSVLSAGDYEDHLLEARAGNPRAMLSLGLMRQTGVGADQNDAVAFAWLRRAALAKDARALSEIGAYYAAGIGAPRDDARAVRNFNLSAAADAASGQTALGWALATGRGVEADAVKARALFETAANKGNALAALNLGRMYADGLGGARDSEAANAWYSKAADQGFAPAQYAFAVMALQPGNDPASAEASLAMASRAALYLQQAAAQGFPDAQALLGVLYARGIGVTKDDAMAKAWSDKARLFSQNEAKQNLPPAVLHPQARAD